MVLDDEALHDFPDDGALVVRQQANALVHEVLGRSLDELPPVTRRVLEAIVEAVKAKRSRLEPFKRLACTLKAHLGGVVRGMLDGRSNAYVKAMNGLLQQTKRAARGFRDVQNFIAIAHLRMSKLKHLPNNPLVPAIPLDHGRYRHVC